MEEATTLDKSLPPSTTAAAVSSQVDSMPRTIGSLMTSAIPSFCFCHHTRRHYMSAEGWTGRLKPAGFLPGRTPKSTDIVYASTFPG